MIRTMLRRNALPTISMARSPGSRSPMSTLSIRRVAVLARDKSSAVKLTFGPGTLTLFSSSPDYGEATEEIPIRYSGDTISTGFNARYVLDVLSVIDGESVTLQMENPLSPCLIREPGNAGFRCVVMPVKI